MSDRSPAASASIAPVSHDHARHDSWWPALGGALTTSVLAVNAGLLLIVALVNSMGWWLQVENVEGPVGEGDGVLASLVPGVVGAFLLGFAMLISVVALALAVAVLFFVVVPFALRFRRADPVQRRWRVMLVGAAIGVAIALCVATPFEMVFGPDVIGLRLFPGAALGGALIGSVLGLVLVSVARRSPRTGAVLFAMSAVVLIAEILWIATMFSS